MSFAIDRPARMKLKDLADEREPVDRNAIIGDRRGW